MIPGECTVGRRVRWVHPCGIQADGAITRPAEPTGEGDHVTWIRTDDDGEEWPVFADRLVAIPEVGP